MPTEATILLRRLRYLRPVIGKRVSPYIWPFLASAASNAFWTRTFGDARVVIMEDMGPAHTPDIPTSEGTLQTQFQDDQTGRTLILVVALWEKLDTPVKCVNAAFEAFSSELNLRLGHRIGALKNAYDAHNQQELDQLIKEIKDYVHKAVESATKSKLSAWDKVRIAAGWMTLDQFVDAGFKVFSNLEATPVTLTFKGSSFDHREYDIQGALEIGQTTSPVTPGEACPDEVRAVSAAQSTVDDIKAQIRALQEELQHASPSEKPALIKEIKRIREEELPGANAALEEAQRALRDCLARQPVPVPVPTPHHPPG